MRIREGVIIAAGLGKRLGLGIPKAIVRVAGSPLLSWALWTFKKLEVKKAFVVVGYKAHKVKSLFSNKKDTHSLDVEFIYNPNYRGGNGLSVLMAEGYVGNRFLLSMVDHIFNPRSLRGLPLIAEGDLVIGVDSRPRLVNPEEATKVRLNGRKVVAVGKEIWPYDAVDCGIFACTPAIFSAISEALEMGLEEWNDAKQILANRGRVTSYDIKGAFWLDVDFPADLKRARRLVRKMLGMLPVPKEVSVKEPLEELIEEPVEELEKI